MPETCEDWLVLVNICIYYVWQTHAIYQILSYPVDFKATGIFEIHWVRQYLVNIVLFQIKTCKHLKWLSKLESKVNVRPVNIFANFWHWYCVQCHYVLWSLDDDVWHGLDIKNVIATLPIGADLNTLRPRQNGRHFPDDIFKCVILNENVWISIKIALKFVCKGPINSILALVQIMAWCRPGDKPSSEAMMVGLLTHICVPASMS